MYYGQINMKFTHLICQEGGCKNNPGFSLLLIRQMALNPSLLFDPPPSILDDHGLGSMDVLVLDFFPANDALLLLLDAAGRLARPVWLRRRCPPL